MASARRCLGIDIGSHTIKIAELVLEKGELRLARLLSADMPVGPDAKLEERNSAITQTVRNLVKENKINTKEAVFCISGQSVFVRRIPLPKAPKARMQKMVYFESRQLIPFPLEQTLIEYQVFETEKENEVEVLLVAMKQETHKGFTRLIRRLGLKPIGVSVSPLALFNGQELSRFVPEKGDGQKGGGLFGGMALGGKKKGEKKSKKKDKKKAPEDDENAEGMDDEIEDFDALADEDLELGAGGFEEIRAYVNIGARTTDLAICKANSKNVGFTRSIPIGGIQITKSILNVCQLDTPNQAEKMKREQTAVLSGMFEFEADRSQYNELACNAATKVADRLIAEIRRSIDFFVAQPDGAAVDLVALSGGGARLSYLLSYMEERLGLPVELSASLGNEKIQVSPRLGEEVDAAEYKIALGLASQGLALSPIAINFLPDDIRSSQSMGPQNLDYVILGAMLGAMIFFGSQIGKPSRVKYTEQISQYQAKLRQMKPIQEAKSWVDNMAVQMDQRMDKLVPAFYERDYWLRLVTRVQDSNTYNNVLITQIFCTPDYEERSQGSVRLVGEAEQQSAVTSFLRELKRAGNKPLIQSAEVAYISEMPVASDFFKKDVYRFQIVVQAGSKKGKTITKTTQPPTVATPVVQEETGLSRRRGMINR